MILIPVPVHQIDLPVQVQCRTFFHGQLQCSLRDHRSAQSGLSPLAIGTDACLQRVLGVPGITGVCVPNAPGNGRTDIRQNDGLIVPRTGAHMYWGIGPAPISKLEVETEARVLWVGMCPDEGCEEVVSDWSCSRMHSRRRERSRV